MNAKGISPVIATVLLVLVAVTVTLILIPFLTSMTSEQTAKTKDLAGQAPAGATFLIKSCTISGTTATIVLDNTGAKDLNNFTVMCLDSTGDTVATASISPNMAAGATKKVTVTCTATTKRVKVRSTDYSSLESERDCTT